MKRVITLTTPAGRRCSFRIKASISLSELTVNEADGVVGELADRLMQAVTGLRYSGLRLSEVTLKRAGQQ